MPTARRTVAFYLQGLNRTWRRREMSSARQLREHQRSIAKVVSGISLIVLIILGATIPFTSVLIWQDPETGNSLTQYPRGWIPAEVFFPRQRIEAVFVLLPAVATVITI